VGPREASRSYLPGPARIALPADAGQRAATLAFAVAFEHFAEYTLYGVFFLVISWAQLIWPVILLWRPSRLWLSVGALDVVSCVLEFGLIVGCAALLWRPSLSDRPVARRGALASAAALIAVPVAVIAATTAVMTPGWAGPEGPAGMASGSMSCSSSSSQSSSTAQDPGMGDIGSTDGQPDMQMYGSTAPPTAQQVVAAGS
jgi:hypothetical protein